MIDAGVQLLLSLLSLIPNLLHFDADTPTKDAKGWVLLLDGDAYLLDGRAFLEDGRGDSGGDVFQEFRWDSHFPTGDADEAGVVGRAFQLVIAPSRSIYIDKSRDGDIEVSPHGALLRRDAMTGIDLDAIDSNLYLTI